MITTHPGEVRVLDTLEALGQQAAQAALFGKIRSKRLKRRSKGLRAPQQGAHAECARTCAGLANYV